MFSGFFVPVGGGFGVATEPKVAGSNPAGRTLSRQRDRKSTRVNSSHQIITYAVFCLKKKKEPPHRRLDREELPQPGPALPRIDPGGHARPDTLRREVRLAAGLQVLDLRQQVVPEARR